MKFRTRFNKILNKIRFMFGYGYFVSISNLDKEFWISPSKRLGTTTIGVSAPSWTGMTDFFPRGELYQWFKSNNIKGKWGFEEKQKIIDKGKHETSYILEYFLRFELKDDAMQFKLTWG